MLAYTHRATLLALAFALGVVSVPACDEDDEVGTPCESDEDCSDGLTCDVHDGKGTCQHEHGHRSETDPVDVQAP